MYAHTVYTIPQAQFTSRFPTLLLAIKLLTKKNVELYYNAKLFMNSSTLDFICFQTPKGRIINHT